MHSSSSEFKRSESFEENVLIVEKNISSKKRGGLILLNKNNTLSSQTASKVEKLVEGGKVSDDVSECEASDNKSLARVKREKIKLKKWRVIKKMTIMIGVSNFSMKT